MTFFRLLLLLFPATFRAAFGEEMGHVFAAQRQEARTAGLTATLRLWLRTIKGITAAAWHERRESRGPRRGRRTATTDGDGGCDGRDERRTGDGERGGVSTRAPLRPHARGGDREGADFRLSLPRAD